SLKTQIRDLKKELGIITHEGQIPIFNMDSIHEAYESGKDPIPTGWIEATPENIKREYEFWHPWEIDREALRRNPENED
ncbi:hypothetical protein KAT51_07525, partial [bacterium]|nr:hypothetical protein [bacterium]